MTVYIRFLKLFPAICSFALFATSAHATLDSWKAPWVNSFQDCMSNGPLTEKKSCYNNRVSGIGEANAIESCLMERINKASCSNSREEVENAQSMGVVMSESKICYDTIDVCRAEFNSMRTNHISDLALADRVGGTSSSEPACTDIDRLKGLCDKGEEGTSVDKDTSAETCEVQGSSDDVQVFENGRVKVCMPDGDGTTGRWVAYEECSKIADSGMQQRCLAKEASDVADARDTKPADLNSDGVTTKEEFEEADTDGNGFLSQEEKEAAAALKAANPEKASACSAAFSEATLCCENPMACLIGGNNEKVGNNISAGIGIVMQGGQMYAAGKQQEGDFSGQPSTAMCDFMGKASTAGVGINMASAAVCMQKKVACNQICAEIDDSKCDHLNGSIAQSAIQGLSMAMASQIADRCQSMTASSNGLSPSDIDFLPDCSDPANSSNPNCNGECSGPDAASNPFCKAGGGTGSNGSGGATSYAAHNADFGDNGNFDSNPDMMDGVDGQENLGFAAESTAQANAIQGGGGGGMASGAGGASLGSEGGGGGGGPGHNTSVLKGLSGGGGYVGPSTSRMAVDSGGGGFSGYGRGSKKAESGIDLKQFLPGGKKDPRKRTVAGMNINVASQIGRKETNIFQTMSVKYRQMCKLKRMWDCPNLSKAMGK